MVPIEKGTAMSKRCSITESGVQLSLPTHISYCFFFPSPHSFIQCILVLEASVRYEIGIKDCDGMKGGVNTRWSLGTLSSMPLTSPSAVIKTTLAAIKPKPRMC